MPPEPVDDPGSLGHQVLAIGEHQPDVTIRAIQTSGRTLRLTESRPGHGQGIDRI
jgi:hypothetical protein